MSISTQTFIDKMQPRAAKIALKIKANFTNQYREMKFRKININFENNKTYIANSRYDTGPLK